MESVHDGLVNIVKKELKSRDFKNIFDHVEYRGKTGVCGEIDVYAIKDDYVLSFEIKCRNCYKNHKKAEEQLERSEHNFFGHNKRLFKFMVYYNRGVPKYEWIKKH